ncbi:MAG: ExbD/TolR family protein [Zoogloea sp.]|uniref:ExbD/TolR family protein n=1 Tax=Zoogloea sp. TaxID=49181 RepID=UPI003F30B1FF
MRLWEEKPRHPARIEIIPMIDVMMFLLVFFVLLSLNVIPSTGVKTTLPSASSAQENHDLHTAIITIPAQGALQLDGKNVEADYLAAALQALKQKHERISVVVKGDASVELQRLLDVMDIVKESGLEAVSIAAKRKSN